MDDEEFEPEFEETFTSARKKRKTSDLSLVEETAEEKEKRKEYERKRRETLSAAFDDLKKVLLEHKCRAASVDSRQQILLEASRCLRVLADKRKRSGSDWMSGVTEIPGLRELVHYVEELRLHSAEEPSGGASSNGSAAPRSRRSSTAASTATLSDFESSSPQREEMSSPSSFEQSPHNRSASNSPLPQNSSGPAPSKRRVRNKLSVSTDEAKQALAAPPSASHLSMGLQSAPYLQNHVQMAPPQTYMPMFSQNGVSMEQTMPQNTYLGPFMDASGMTQYNSPFLTTGAFGGVSYPNTPQDMSQIRLGNLFIKSEQSHEAFQAGVTAATSVAGGSRPSAYVAPSSAPNRSFGRGGGAAARTVPLQSRTDPTLVDYHMHDPSAPRTTAPNLAEAYDLENLGGSRIMEFSRHLLVILFFGVFFVSGVIPGVTQVTNASSRRLLGITLVEDDSTTHWALNLLAVFAICLWNFLSSSWLWVLSIIYVVVYLILLFICEPYLAPPSVFKREAMLQENLAYQCVNLKQRRKHMTSALSYLGRHFPKSNIHLAAALAWQTFRAFGHFFWVGYYLERATIFSKNRPQYRIAALQTIQLYSHMITRLQLVVSPYRLLYLLISLFNMSSSLDCPTVIAEIYSLIAFAIEYRFPSFSFLAPIVWACAWRSATHKDVSSDRTAVFVGFGAMKAFIGGNWDKVKKLARILGPSLRQLQRLPSQRAEGKAKAKNHNNNRLLALQEDLAFVPLTIAATEIAQGNLDKGAEFANDAISLIYHSGFKADFLVYSVETNAAVLFFAYVSILKMQLPEAAKHLTSLETGTLPGYNLGCSRIIYFGFKAMYQYQLGGLLKAWESVQQASKLESGVLQGAPIWTIHMFPVYMDVAVRLWEQAKSLRTHSKVEKSNPLSEDEAALVAVSDDQFSAVLTDGINKLQNFTKNFPTSVTPQLLHYRALQKVMLNDLKAATPLFTQSLKASDSMSMKLIHGKTLLEVAKSFKDGFQLPGDSKATPYKDILTKSNEIFRTCGDTLDSRVAEQFLAL